MVSNKVLLQRLEQLEDQQAKMTLLMETCAMLFDQQREINDQLKIWQAVVSEIIRKQQEFLFPDSQPKWEN